MVESGSRPPRCAQAAWRRERMPMQPNGMERSKTRIFRYGAGRWLGMGSCDYCGQCHILPLLVRTER
jgi:hypothetical protein